MEEAKPGRGESGHGGHYIAAVTGSGNSEYLIRWVAMTAHRLNASWTALHVRGRDQAQGLEDVEKNLSLAKNLGAEVVSIIDNDIAACIVRYARIKHAKALVIGKADDEALPFLGRRSIMDEVLRQSGDLDVFILRGNAPVPLWRRRSGRAPRSGTATGIPFALLALGAVTVLGLLAQPALGYRSISILYLWAIISLPFVSSRIVVIASAMLSALLWNFLFIPPRLTFSIASLEDILMFSAFFLAAFAGGFLTSRLKEKESALSLRERRMVFLYGFTKAITRVRGVEAVAALAQDYLVEHLRLSSVIFLCDGEGRLDTNQAVCEARDYDWRRSAFDEEKAKRCFRSKESVADGDDRVYYPLGSQETVVGLLFVDGGGSLTIRGESRDILATLADNIALALERELLAVENERNKMAGESARLSKILLNHVSHELRTPLTTIKGAVSGLLDIGNDEDQHLRSALLNETLIAANRLNALVEDLLAMSRLEAGRLRPRIETAYLSELMGAAHMALGMDLGARTIKIQEAAKDSEIEADPSLMVQVFRNVLRNFAMYTPDRSALVVDVETEAGYSLIRFSDNGPGVRARELPLLFDTFFRGEGSALRQGCGLGLSICKGIVEAHGGSIAAGSAEGGGLLLVVRMPRKVEL
jgi:two-component system, OmpR family, sensor histidine kinase KdpD